ncbi:hypothetical protein B4U79_18456 [Dinothrombium tinctorium]|uniref:PPM-type phosphatase domain-containing protein n=1 Tax=Dinothrombium tinctorium TaxID=1965070 RepID=A0A3S3NHT6_9ACAR|nr:hypothetical protein B4U79_18456 [Dinothrombium tinctorium]
MGLMPTRVLGDTHIKQIKLPRKKDSLSPVPEINIIRNASFAILVTDGITDIISSNDMCEIIKNKKCIFKAANKISKLQTI